MTREKITRRQKNISRLLREKKQAQRVEEMQQKFQSLEREWAQEFIDPRDTRPFIIKALKTLSKRKEGRPKRKHENIRL